MNIITDEMIDVACAAYWWEGKGWGTTWQDLVGRDDHRLPIWRAKMRAAIDAISSISEEGDIKNEWRDDDQHFQGYKA